MTIKDLAFDRIIDLEKSLGKLKRSLGTAMSVREMSSITLSRYKFNHRTYMINIKIFNELSGQNYEAQFEAIE